MIDAQPRPGGMPDNVKLQGAATGCLGRCPARDYRIFCRWPHLSRHLHGFCKKKAREQTAGFVLQGRRRAADGRNHSFRLLGC